MKKLHFILTLTFLIYNSVNIYSQKKLSLNFGFEEVENEEPTGWYQFGQGDYTLKLENANSKEGSYSASISHNGGETNFKAWAFDIPSIYEGNKIKLTGYLKTENVSDGYAGLWMRIDPNIAFDNMNNRGVTGTNDWAKYEIELDLKADQSKKIVIGAILVGKGKLWVDNLSVSIDGIPFQNAKLKKLLLTDQDQEFDSGSKINITDLNSQKINNLELLGKIWGFLKYHHPSVKKGNYNWDYELFRIMPKIIDINDNNQRDQIILDWINSLGALEECKKCKDPKEDSFLKPDLDWIYNNISSSLKSKLLKVYKKRGVGENFYVGMFSGIGNPEFKHENSYNSMPYPDLGFRLLALYKYWNIIQYFFPNRHLIDKDWGSIMKEYIPKLVNAKNELEYELAILQIIGSIKDTHANVWRGGNKINEWKGKFYAPFKVNFIDDKLVITDYYNEEYRSLIGLDEGDIITKINNIEIEDIIKNKRSYYPASNYPTQLRDLAEDILRSTKKIIEIEYFKDGIKGRKSLNLYEAKNLNLYRWYLPERNKKSYRMLENNIGYITLKNIKQEDIPEIKKQFKNAKGIVVDIRNYPSTFVVFSLAPFFTSQSTPFVKFSKGNINNPGEFLFSQALKLGETTNDHYKGKVVVLINEITQSQAEYTTMALQAGDNTTVIGSTTAGADGNISSIFLPGGIFTYISGIGVYYPDGRETQRVGIIPDIVVKPTIKGIKQGKDEVLEKAIEIINKQ